MESTCHRCSATLEPDANYCLQCGAPQVRYTPSAENGSIAAESQQADRASLSDPIHSVQWKLTIRIAAVAALIVGVLSTLLAAGSVLWVAIGAILVIGAYRKRIPQAVLPPRMGARIGALVGMMAAAVALAGNAVFLVIQRFGLHQGKLIDTELTSIVTQAAQRASAVDPQAPVRVFTSFWLSAEGRIGLILITMGFLALLILIFAIAGGALGAQIYRRPSNHNAV